MSYPKFLIRCLPILVLGLFVSSVAAKASSRPRLIVLTDISSIKTGVRDPGDAQSMIRLMLYSDDFDIEGLIASSGLGHGHVVRPQNIRKIVDAYGEVRPNLVLHDKNYPTAYSLRQMIKSGQPNADGGMPVFHSIGAGKDTQASQWIIRMVDKPDSRPLWITIWGGSADLAQALWTVRQTRSPKEVAQFIAKIRVIASGDQDSTGTWIKSQFPDLFYATRGEGGRGMYRGGDTTSINSAWVRTHIKGHGALGDIYPEYHGGDKWAWKLGKIHGIKGGDSATFMGLIHNGLDGQGHLTWDNWGGRIKQDANNPHHYHDAIDAVGTYQTDISPYLASVYRWRPTFQSDYAARFDWCVQLYSQANHAPVDSSGATVVDKNIVAGEKVKLRSGDWHDPDGNNLTYHWQVLESEGTYSKNIKIQNNSSQSAEFSAPAVTHPQTIHVLLTVTDDGYPVLSSYNRFISSYKRFNFTVSPTSKPNPPKPHPVSKPRLIVLTDITSTQSGVREPDDAQSMIRLMLYSDEFDIEGLIASSGLQHGHVVRPENIRKIVDAYGEVQPNLMLHDKNYPTADYLRQMIKSGQPNADRGIPVFHSIGAGKNTEASQWIIRMVDNPDDRPVWILAWGGSADLAQALWTVKNTRSPQEVARFTAKIRVIASGDQDSTGPWIKSQFSDLFYATRGEGGRGMYRGGDMSLVSSAWVQNHIKGHGALGDIYPDYQGGDPYAWKIGKIHGIKGGDSSSFMGLIHNGLNGQGHLTLENWGGRIQKDADNPHHYHDAIDQVGNYRKDLSPYWASVYRWRPTFQSEYAARFDWCVQPYSQANHAPVDSSGTDAIDKNIVAGYRVNLQSGDWHDPDGNNLTYHWQVLSSESSYSNQINIGNKSSRSAEFSAPNVNHSQTIHMLLRVTDDGYPALSSYKRFNFTVHPN